MKKTTKRRSLLALVSLLIVACMTLLGIPVSATTATDVWDGSVSTDWYTNAAALGNDGTEAKPYEINTAADLAGLASLVAIDNDECMSGKYIKLTQNLDLDGRAWNSIGKQSNPFTGKFDGGNFTVSNFTMSDQGVHTGLFSNLNTGAAVLWELHQARIRFITVTPRISDLEQPHSTLAV